MNSCSRCLHICSSHYRFHSLLEASRNASHWCTQHKSERHYSTQTAKGTVKARHRESINDFVFSLTPEEKGELLASLTKAERISRAESSTQVSEIPKPSRSQLKYGRASSLAICDYNSLICFIILYACV